jgi:hypothetical protein
MFMICVSSKLHMSIYIIFLLFISIKCQYPVYFPDTECQLFFTVMKSRLLIREKNKMLCCYVSLFIAAAHCRQSTNFSNGPRSCSAIL